MRLPFALFSALVMFGMVPGAHAQGCALCYTTAAATSAAAQRSLNVGIFALLAPALTMFLAVMYLLYRRAAAASA